MLFITFIDSLKWPVPEIQFRVHPRLLLGWSEFCRHFTTQTKNPSVQTEVTVPLHWIKQLDE